MELIAIPDLERNPEKLEEYKNIFSQLKEKLGNEDIRIYREKLLSRCDWTPSYARATYTGKIKEGIELTELELSMICDNGFSHFGGNSVINPDRTFKVIIYKD